MKPPKTPNNNGQRPEGQKTIMEQLSEDENNLKLAIERLEDVIANPERIPDGFTKDNCRTLLEEAKELQKRFEKPLSDVPTERAPLKIRQNTMYERLSYDTRRTIKNILIITAIGGGVGLAGGNIAQHIYQNAIGYKPNVENVERVPAEMEQEGGLWSRAVDKARRGYKKIKQVTQPKKALQDSLNETGSMLNKMAAFGDSVVFWVSFFSMFYFSAKGTGWVLRKKQLNASDAIGKDNDEAAEAKINELLEDRNRVVAYLHGLGNRQILTPAERRRVTEWATGMTEDLKAIGGNVLKSLPSEHPEGDDEEGGEIELDLDDIEEIDEVSAA